MSTSAGTITGTFGWSNTPLAQGMREAEQMAKTTASKVAATLNEVPRKVNWGRLAQQNEQFLAPIRRGRTAADFAPAPAGKYKLPAEEEGPAGRSLLTSYRFARGVAALTGAHLLIKKVEELAEASIEAQSKLQLLSSKSGASGFQTTGGLGSRLSEQTEGLEADHLRRLQEGHGFGPIQKAMRQSMLQMAGQGSPAEQDAAEDQRRQELRKAAAETIGKMAEKQRQVNLAAKEELSGSERQAALSRAQISHEEKLGELARAEAAAGVGKTDAMNAENERYQDEIAALTRIADLKEAEAHSEIDLAMLRKTAVTSAQLHNQQIMERLRLNKAEAAGPSTQERRDQLAAQRIGLEADQDAGLLAQSRRPFAEREAEIRKAKDDKRDLDRLKANGGLLNVHRDMSGNVIGGMDPFTNEHVNLREGNRTLDQTYRRNGDAYDVATGKEKPFTKTDMDELFRKYLGGD
jgi:hypothetical protein